MKSVKKHRILEAGDFSLVRYHSGMIYIYRMNNCAETNMSSHKALV